MSSPAEAAPDHGFAAYRRVLGTPGVAAIAASSVLARIPAGMGAVALVLYVHGATGSFAAAGVAAGAFTIGLGITGPLLARLIDRRGSAPIVLPCALVSSAALVGVVALGHADAGVVPLATMAALAGAALPPVGSVARLQLARRVDRHDLTTTYAIDALLVEVIFISGPLLAGILTATVGAGDGLVAAAVIGALGTLWFVTVGRVEPTDRSATEHHGWRGALVSPGVRLIVLTSAPMGVTFGALDVALPAFGTVHGSSALGGSFAATLAVGSAIGGLAYGLRPRSLGHPRRAFLSLSTLQAVTCVPVLLATEIPTMFVAAAIAGLCVAPLRHRPQPAHPGGGGARNLDRGLHLDGPGGHGWRQRRLRSRRTAGRGQ
jgi:MFS family permease